MCSLIRDLNYFFLPSPRELTHRAKDDLNNIPFVVTNIKTIATHDLTISTGAA